VMSIAPVERPVASATYGFVRFIGGGLAPYVAAKLVVHYNTHVPFLIGAGAVVAAAIVLSTVHSALDAADRGEIAQPSQTDDLDALSVSDSPAGPDAPVPATSSHRSS
jgi:MFS transporter, ACDE family, multidrug resistance protein